jgi:hypothetical protein
MPAGPESCGFDPYGCADNMCGTSEVPSASRPSLCNPQVGRGGPGADIMAAQQNTFFNYVNVSGMPLVPGRPSRKLRRS